jgi:hypothetical protein
VQAGSSEARPAQVLATQVATEAMGRSMAYESRAAKAAKTVAARPCRTEEIGGARPPSPVHVAAPLRCAASSYSFLLVVYEFQATKEEAPVARDTVVWVTAM